MSDDRETNNTAVITETEESESEEKGRTFRDYVHMVTKHWVGLVVLTLVGLVGGVLYARFIKKPKYQASTQVMIVNTDTTAETSNTTNNISEARAKTQIAYGYMTSDEVVKEVAKGLVDKGYKEYLSEKNTYDVSAVRKLYSVTIPTVVSNTTSIFIDVTATTQKENLALDVANIVPEVTIRLANDKDSLGYAYLRNSLASMGSATTAKDTSTKGAVIAIVGTLIGFVIGILYGIIYEIADTRVVRRDELEELTGCKVIGMIPDYKVASGDEKSEETAKEEK